MACNLAAADSGGNRRPAAVRGPRFGVQRPRGIPSRREGTRHPWTAPARNIRYPIVYSSLPFRSSHHSPKHNSKPSKLCAERADCPGLILCMWGNRTSAVHWSCRLAAQAYITIVVLQISTLETSSRYVFWHGCFHIKNILYYLL